jgi:hypothetical protein
LYASDSAACLNAVICPHAGRVGSRCRPMFETETSMEHCAEEL